MAINPTDKDIGRKVVWYPSLETHRDFVEMAERTLGVVAACFGEMVFPQKAACIPHTAAVRFDQMFDGGKDPYWPLAWEALDWADDL